MSREESTKGAAGPGGADGDSEEGPKTIGVEDLPIPNLQQFLRQLDRDIQVMSINVQGLRKGHKGFADSRAAVQTLSEADEGKEMLVPLANGMYVPGKLASTKDILVDVGAGYYVTKDVAGATAYLDKRVKELTAAIENSTAALNEKMEQRDTMHGVLQQKLSLVARAQRSE